LPEEFVLFGGSEVAEMLGDSGGRYPLAYNGKDFVSMSDRRLAYLNDLADFDEVRGFDTEIVDTDMFFATGLGGKVSGLENTDSPKPFVYANLSHGSESGTF
jgi:hypothetical protein